MRREQPAHESWPRGAEEKVRQRLGLRVVDARSETRFFGQSGDLAQSAADAVRIARELDRAGIGQEFALARYASLDQSSEENPDVTQHPQPQAPANRHQD